MQAQLTKEWTHARAHHEAHLSRNQRLSIEKVTTQDELIARLRSPQSAYLQRRSQRVLQKIHPVLAQLGSFTHIINIFVQGQEIASLVWGPIALVLEVSLPCISNLDLLADSN